MKKGGAVFYISIAVTILIVLWGLLLPTGFENAANAAFNFIGDNFGWFYIITMFSFVAFAIFIAFSKYGKIRLGKDDDKPEYSTISWFAMLFSAGMGIGLVFWGVAEPLNHFINPVGVASGSVAAADFAIKKSFFHWGLHPWANYSVLALALAYMQFRKNKPGLISSVFIPLLGEERVKGPIGKAIDILAVFATVAGVATSLGLGTLQINSGLNFLFNIPETDAIKLAIVGIVTVLFMISAITGLDKGIKFLSNLNVSIATILLLATLIIGPTVLIINTFVDGLGAYVGNFLRDSFQINPFGDSSWYTGWTVFYWAWWIAWAPFVGTFIARISKGRTIKEFVGGVLLAPTLASFLWFAVFGATGINAGVEVATGAITNTSTAFFAVMQNYPLGSLISMIALLLLCTFFITSADSATFVLGMLSSKGNLNPKTSRKVIWGIIQSSLALALMLGSVNGLQMLQTASIVAAFPFAFIMIFAMFALIKVLKTDPLITK
jgi:glycine betaine transporter